MNCFQKKGETGLELVYRKLSIPLSRWAIKLNLSPNLFSFLFLFGTIAVSILYIYRLHLIGSLLWIAIIVFDHIDGNVARYYIKHRNRKPNWNMKLLDYKIHYIFEWIPLLIISSNYGILWIGILSYVAMLLRELLLIRYKILRRKANV